MVVSDDKRIVMTLDAGGTNFVFSAMQGNREIIEPVKLSPDVTDLDQTLKSVIEGFSRVKARLGANPSAISFAFPGPADYPAGIIGDLPNLPAFRGGVPLGPLLEHHFGLPVFINNDGNLFTYGEALTGFIPFINKRLEEEGSPKRFNNLIGITLGTGFGLGLVLGTHLVAGDNSNGGEGWLLRDLLTPERNIEEHLSREGIRRYYAKKSGIKLEEAGDPGQIYKIARGEAPGSAEAARETFNDFGTVLGEGLANAITLFDGIVVLGGGVAGAFDLFAPAMIEQMRSSFNLNDGTKLQRLIPEIYNLEEPGGMEAMVKGSQKDLVIPGTDKKVKYDPALRTGVAVSRNDTAVSIARGAYAFAINALDS